MNPVGGKLGLFADGDQVSAWAQEAVSALMQAGAVDGNPDGKLHPQQRVTRGEIAKITAYFLK